MLDPVPPGPFGDVKAPARTQAAVREALRRVLARPDAGHIRFSNADRRRGIAAGGDPWPYTDLHSHVYNEVAICLSGTCAIEMLGGHLPLSVGDLCFVTAADEHRERALAAHLPYRLLWVRAEAGTAWLWISRYAPSPERRFTTADVARIAGVEDALLVRTQVEARVGRERFREPALSYLSAFYWTLERGTWDADLAVPRIVQDACAWVHQRYGEPIGPSAVAAALGVGAEHLATAFKRFTGKTLRDFITDARMQEALHLLTHTGMSVAEVAARCGYPDPYYFSRVCRRWTGMSPSRVRVRPPEARPAPRATGPLGSASWMPPPEEPASPAQKRA